MARKYQLHGAFPSKAGDSAYQVAQKNGFEGTEQEWLKSLTGPKGNPGPQGISGIHTGTEPPVNDDVTVWINPDDDGSFESVEYYETDLTIETESRDITLNTPCLIADFHELHIHLTTNQNPFELCMDVGGEHTSLINTPSGTNAGVHILLAASHDRSMMNLCVQSAANTDNAQPSVPDRTAAVQNEAASLRLYPKDNSVSFMPDTQIRAWGVYRSQGTGVLKIKNIETGEWETVKTLKGDKGEKGDKGDKGDVGTVPVASPDTLGGVQPVEKTEAMTNPVGVDALGGLWSAGGKEIDELLIDFTTEAEVVQFDLPLTNGIGSRLNAASEIIVVITVKKPVSDEGTAYGTVQIRSYRTQGSWYPFTFLYADISPTNAISYGRDGHGVSIIRRDATSKFGIVIQAYCAENVSSIGTKTSLGSKFIGNKLFVADSDIIRVESVLPMGIGTNIKVYARGYLA